MSLMARSGVDAVSDTLLGMREQQKGCRTRSFELRAQRS